MTKPFILQSKLEGYVTLNAGEWGIPSDIVAVVGDRYTFLYSSCVFRKKHGIVTFYSIVCSGKEVIIIIWFCKQMHQIHASMTFEIRRFSLHSSTWHYNIIKHELFLWCAIDKY